MTPLRSVVPRQLRHSHARVRTSPTTKRSEDEIQSQRSDRFHGVTTRSVLLFRSHTR